MSDVVSDHKNSCFFVIIDFARAIQNKVKIPAINQFLSDAVQGNVGQASYVLYRKITVPNVNVRELKKSRLLQNIFFKSHEYDFVPVGVKDLPSNASRILFRFQNFPKIDLGKIRNPETLVRLQEYKRFFDLIERELIPCDSRSYANYQKFLSDVRDYYRALAESLFLAIDPRDRRFYANYSKRFSDGSDIYRASAPVTVSSLPAIDPREASDSFRRENDKYVSYIDPENIFQLQEGVRHFVQMSDSVRVRWVIRAKDGEELADDDRGRVKAYLSSFAQNFKFVEIAFGESKTDVFGNSEKTAIGDLLPLLIIRSSEQLDVIRSQVSAEDVADLKRFPEEWRKIIQRAQEALPDAIKGEARASEYPILISANTKKQVSDNLKRYAADKGLSALAYLLYLYAVRMLADSHLLFLRKNYEEKAVSADDIDRSAVEELLNNADVYAGGIIELVENALLYSTKKTALVSIRHRKTRLGSAEDDIAANAAARKELNKRYGVSVDRSYYGYLEIEVADISDCDIVETFAERHKEKFPNFGTACEKGDPINVFFRNRCSSCAEACFCAPVSESFSAAAHIAHHYGLRLLENVVTQNNGVFSVQSGKHRYGQACRKTDNEEYSSDASSYFHGTDYRILVPIGEQTFAEIAETSLSEHALLDIDLIEKKDPSPIPWISDARSSLNEFTSIEKPRQLTFNDALIAAVSTICASENEKFTKINIIDRLAKEILDVKALAEGVYLNEIAAEGLSLKNVEILCKFLFEKIAKSNQKGKLNFAINFGHDDGRYSKMEAAVKYFSIFYDKYRSDHLKNAQIAICSREASGCGRVHFVIAGYDSQSAYRSARLFAYYHSEEAFPLLRSIKYFNHTMAADKALTAAESKSASPQEAPVILFPFDLYLKNNSGESYFLDRMKELLNKDMTVGDDGCKISHTHVRLGSKLHIGEFFEAELLFHNLANTYKFAYLTARNILKTLEKGDRSEAPLVLVNYENYSAIFAEEICRILKAKTNKEIFVASFVTPEEETGLGIGVGVRFPEALSKYLDGSGAQKPQFAVLVPIGSSMSTMYKVRTIAKREFNSQFSEILKDQADDGDFIAFEAVVAVANDLSQGEGAVQLEKAYFERNEAEKYLKLQKRDNSDAPNVRYQILLQTQWQDPNDKCIYCQEDRALAQVDHSSTVPDMIFERKPSARVTYRELIGRIRQYENGTSDAKRALAVEEEKIKTLKGGIEYGHTYRGSNHFLYYLDFQGFFEREKGKVEVWLKNVVAPKLDKDAFNIVVSPLHETNAGFLKAVADHAFEHNIRFLHVDMEHTYREDARAKFSIVSREYKKIIETNRNAKVKFYYVDDSITTGATFARAKNIITMLIEEAGSVHNAFVFDEIFLLINRSSFDTLNTFVRNPITDVHAYLCLAAPSYNTERDICPKCRMHKKYELLRRRSATNRLSTEFERLTEKHAKIHVEVFKKRGQERFFANVANLKWFLSWAYLNEKIASGSKKGASTDELTQALDLTSKLLEASKEGERQYRAQLEALSEQDRDLIYRKFREYVLNERNYDRLLHTHQIYLALEGAAKACEREKGGEAKTDERIAEELTERTKKAIIDLLYDQIIGKKTRHTGLEKTLKAEKLASYLKVLSREFLSSYYHIAQATLDIVGAFFLGIVGLDYTAKIGVSLREKFQSLLSVVKNTDPEKPSNFRSDIFPVQQYLFVETLLKRIACFQSTEILDENVFFAICECVGHLCDKYDGKGSYASFWSDMDKTEGKNQEKKNKQKRCKEYQKYNELSDSTIQTDLIKIIKLSTMLTDDDSKCGKIWDLIHKMPDFLENKGKNIADDENEFLREVLQGLQIENTRILYDGIRELRKEFNISEGTSLESFNKNLETAFGGDGLLLRHNPLCNFLSFFEGGRATRENIKQDGKILLDMTKLYCCAEELEQNWDHEKAPYLYENIWTYICEILGYDNCYVVKLVNHAVNLIHQCSTKISDNTRFFERKLKQSDDNIVNILDYERNYRKDDEAIDPDQGHEEQDEKIKYILDTVYAAKIDLADETEQNKEKPQLLAVIRLEYPHRGGKDTFFLVMNKSAASAPEEGPEAAENSAENRAQESGDEARNLQDEQTQKSSDEAINLQKERAQKYEMKSAENSVNEFYDRVNRVLFLHDTLVKCLARDHHALINLKHNYDCVGKISEDDSPAKNTDEQANAAKKTNEIKILHISDLHIDSRKKYDCDNFLADKQYKYDLLAITGDVIAGRGSAAEMVDNYNAASGVIYDLAIKLWGNESNRLRADWRKRVLIVPGNHDYASMNETQTGQDSRKTVAAGVAKKAGDTMAKFAYYIDFIRRTLDYDLGMVDDKLNFIRSFPRLNATFVCLNSCAEINPNRTNKVYLDNDVLDKFRHRLASDENENVYVLMHHTPHYVGCQMNYFADKHGDSLYKIARGREKENREKLWKELNQYFFKCAEYVLLYDTNESKIQDSETKKQVTEESKPKEPQFEYDIPLSATIRSFTERKNDDYSLVLPEISAIEADYKELYYDRQAYFKRISALIQSIEKDPARKITILGGHTHKRFPPKEETKAKEESYLNHINKVFQTLFPQNEQEIDLSLAHGENHPILEAGKFFAEIPDSKKTSEGENEGSGVKENTAETSHTPKNTADMIVGKDTVCKLKYDL